MVTLVQTVADGALLKYNAACKVYDPTLPQLFVKGLANHDSTKLVPER